MYKKITHNITEEHFGHPLATQMKKQMDKHNSKSMGVGDAIADTTHLDTHKQFSKLIWGVRNYIISALGPNDDGTTLLKNNLLTDATMIGQFFSRYYPASAVGSNIATHLTGFVTSLVDVVQLARSSRDYTTQLTAVRTHLDQLARALAAANPKTWSAAQVAPYLTEYVGKLTEQIAARVKKDWKADLAAEYQTNQLMLNGPIEFGTLKDWPDFAHRIASGLAGKPPAV